MPRILDRYVWKDLGPPFAIGVGVFTFFLFIDRIYQLTNLVITKNVPFHLSRRHGGVPRTAALCLRLRPALSSP